jgi:hypothetical protein
MNTTDTIKLSNLAKMARDTLQEMGFALELNRPGFSSASFGRMDYAPSVSAGVPAACVEDA